MAKGLQLDLSLSRWMISETKVSTALLHCIADKKLTVSSAVCLLPSLNSCAAWQMYFPRCAYLISEKKSCDFCFSFKLKPSRLVWSFAILHLEKSSLISAVFIGQVSFSETEYLEYLVEWKPNRSYISYLTWTALLITGTSKILLEF